MEELEKDWLIDFSLSNSRNHSSSLSSSDIKVLLLTHLIHPPLFLAALSIKFTGLFSLNVLLVLFLIKIDKFN